VLRRHPYQIGQPVETRKVEDLTSDAAWDETRRGETETQRLDRNWSDLLQELRVVQTGVQLLTGFLLTLPFQQRFTELSTQAQNVYLATVASAVVATATLVAPVSIHRVLFRQHARASLVAVAHRCAIAGVTFLGLAVCGAVDVITTLVVGSGAGNVAAAAAACIFIVLWLVLPLRLRMASDT
jgi:hypothetical protein